MFFKIIKYNIRKFLYKPKICYKFYVNIRIWNWKEPPFYLYSSKNGKMDIIGIYLFSVVNIPKRKMKNMISAIYITEREKVDKHSWLFSTISDNKISMLYYEITRTQDNMELSIKQKISKIKKLFRIAGVKVEFNLKP